MNRGPAWEAFSLYVRLRDADPFTGLAPCCTCGHRYHYRDMQAGHFVPWKSGNSTRYHERNVHAQCESCNMLESGRWNFYYTFLERKYGQGFPDKLIILGKQTVKIFPHELSELASKYRGEIQRLKKEKNL